ncbi:MAG: DoxX family membrane protein [Candidatus Pacebacteria bacterium]|nr:DoxX family membrane protein [Candidatus Paceibacterota bacterium]
MTTYTVQQSALAHFLFADKKSAPIWLLARLYLGYEFFMAGWGKLWSQTPMSGTDYIVNHSWVGSDAGVALAGFVQGAVAKTAGLHPDVYQWYASFLQSTVLPNVMVWSNAVVLGEIAIGLGLIVGLCTRSAAFFAFFMAFNFLLAGTVSVNPTLIMLALGIMLAHRVAGNWGLDRFARPFCQKICSPRRP